MSVVMPPDWPSQIYIEGFFVSDEGDRRQLEDTTTDVVPTRRLSAVKRAAFVHETAHVRARQILQNHG